MRRIWAGGALLGLLFAAPTVVVAQQSGSPVVLFYTYKPEALTRPSHITPKFSLTPGDEARPAQGALLARGILPLATRGGRNEARVRSSEDLAAYWGSAADAGYAGIAIDEFGSRDRALNQKMREALAILRESHPELYIAVWHGGPLNRHYGRCYAQNADLVMLETYTGARCALGLHFRVKLNGARKAGIAHKTVFALGINDSDKKLEAGAKAWANDEETLRAQMRWIRKNAPDMPGVGFFAARGSAELQRKAEELAWQIFGGGDQPHSKPWRS